MKLYLLLIIPLFLVKDCSNKNSIQTQVFEGVFSVIKIDNILLDKQDINFEIDLLNDTLNGFTGCNRFSTKFKQEENNISFFNSVSSKKYCPKLEVKETLLFDCFKRCSSYKLKSNTLSFYNKLGVLILTAELKN